MKATILSLSTVIFLMFSFPSCSDEDTCNNGVQDGTETGIDCGGSCTSCSQNNQSIMIDGAAQQASSVVAYLNDGFVISSTGYPVVNGLTMSINYSLGLGVLSVSFSNDDENAACVHTGNYATQTDNAYALNPFGYGLLVYASLLSGDQYETSEFASNQTITLTKCDPVNSKISGNFSVTVENPDDQQTMVISGSFTDVSYTDNR